MNKLFKLDWVLLISISLLLAVGLLVLYSISFDGAVLDPANLKKQVLSIGLGFLIMFFLAFFDYRKLGSHATLFYFLTLVLLLAVILFGQTIRGNTGWIGFSGYHIQPVEIAKIVLIIFMASFLSKKKTQLSILVRTIASVVLIFIPIFLILKQPDLGSSAIIVASWATVLSLSGLSKKNLFLLFALGCLVLSLSWFAMKDYQKDRLANFMDPTRDPSGSGYNVVQSIVAVGSGGIFGKGLGHGSQSQLNFLPEKHTDFIFAVIAEELGFSGALAVLVLFGIVFWRLKEIAMSAKDNFGYLTVVGVIAMMFFHLLINIGMNIGVVPVTGVPLPFLSYGGSFMVMVLAAMGIVQSVYMRGINQ